MERSLVCVPPPSKRKQMARRVELNLELKRVEAAQAAARANL